MKKNEIRHTSHGTFRCQHYIVFAPISIREYIDPFIGNRTKQAKNS